MSNAKRNLGIATIAIIIGIGILFHPAAQTAVDKNVTKSLVSKTVVEAPAANKEYKVTNLSLDPNQAIIFNTEVNSDSVGLTINQINKLSKNGKDIYLILASPGGSVFDGMMLIDYMEASTVHINTVVLSLCASMCAQIESHGAKRLSLASGTLMFHQAAGGVDGSLKEMKNRLTFLDLEIAKLDAYVANRAGINREVFDRMVEHELWIDGQDALDKNLIDGLVTIKLNEGKQPFIVSQQLQQRNITPTQTVNLKNPLKDIQ